MADILEVTIPELPLALDTDELEWYGIDKTTNKDVRIPESRFFPKLTAELISDIDYPEITIE